MSASLRQRLWPALAVAVAFAILVSLGVWQVQRLAWKQEQIHLNAVRFNAAPVSLPPADAWDRMDAGALHARRTRVVGTLRPDRQLLWFTAAPGGGPAYHHITPMRLSDGGWILVDRGVDAPDSGTGEVSISGLIRQGETRRWFHPADDPGGNLWFVRDPVRMAAALEFSPVAPVFIEEGGTPPKLPNNHLAYAITWFSLAAGLLVICAVYQFREKHRGWRRA